MSKENETKPAALTAENVMDVINKGNLANSDIVSSAMKKINDERDEKKIEEIKKRVLSSDFFTKKTLLQLRQRRREDAISRKELALRSNLENAIIGFDVTKEYLEHNKVKGDSIEIVMKVNGNDVKKTFKLGDHVDPYVDYMDYDEEKRKIDSDMNEERWESDQQFDKEFNKLREGYNTYGRYF